MTDAKGSEQQPAHHYNKVVEAWGYLLLEDLHYGYFTNDNELLIEATGALTNQMLELAKLQPQDHILDIGCGTGNAACRISKEFSATVIGISPSIQCINDANSKAAKLKLEATVEFRIGNGMAPDFPDASFDCVWVMESSHLMKDKKALIMEAIRVLKPGGRLVLCDVMLKHSLSFQNSVRYSRQLLLLRDVFGEGAMEPLEFYRHQFESNGLEIEDCRDISAETLPTFDRWYDNAIQNREPVIKLIGKENYQQFVNSCDALRTLWNKDVLGYGIIAGRKTV